MFLFYFSTHFKQPLLQTPNFPIKLILVCLLIISNRNSLITYLSTLSILGHSSLWPLRYQTLLVLFLPFLRFLFIFFCCQESGTSGLKLTSSLNHFCFFLMCSNFSGFHCHLHVDHYQVSIISSVPFFLVSDCICNCLWNISTWIISHN